MDNLNYTTTFKNGDANYSPVNKLNNNWLFVEGEEAEATLANAMAMVAEKNGITRNELMHMFPMVLRMLKSKSNWVK